MRRFGKNVCLYLTVICLLAIALMPFGGNAYSPSGYADDAGIFESQAMNLQKDAVSDSRVMQEASEAVVDKHKTDFTVSFKDEEKEESSTEKASENISSDIQEIVTEEISSDPSDTKSESSEEIIDISPQKLNSYAPENASEKIYDLYFFSENVGSLAAADSVNTYKFTLENRCMFSYTVTHDTLGILEGWKVGLYEEYYINGDNGETGYRLLNTLVTDPDVTKDKSVELGLMPGSYRLVVSAGKNYTKEAYKIDVITKEGSGYEIECNDNIYRYTEIYSSVPVRGSASYFENRQDEDWYLFRVYEEGFTELEFRHPAVKDKTTVCWQVILYSEDGTILFSVNSLFTDEIIKSGGLGLSAGNYYILVRNRVYTDITYTLSLTRTDDVGYENETNDTIATANSVALNSVVMGSVSAKNDGIDRDFFKFTVSEAGFTVIEFSHAPISDSEDKNGWNVVLTDSQGNMLYKGVSARADDVIASPVIGLGAGTYYIRIDSENLYHSAEAYYLSISFTESDSWESEFNGNSDNSDVLFPDISLNGVLAEMGTDFDYDWYSFTVPETKNASVIFSHEILDYSKNIFVFTVCDSSGRIIETSDGKTAVDSASDVESVRADYESLSAGTYYIKVTSGLFFDHIPYSIKYTLA